MVYARKHTKTAGNRINTAREKMKKIFLMLVAVFGMAFAANAQADQCKIEGGNGGYLSATVSEKHGNNSYYDWVKVTVTPSVDQPREGKVLCKVIYIRHDNGQEDYVTVEIPFDNIGGYSRQSDTILLPGNADRIKDIEIWGAECKSARRPW